MYTGKGISRQGIIRVKHNDEMHRGNKNIYTNYPATAFDIIGRQISNKTFLAYYL